MQKYFQPIELHEKTFHVPEKNVSTNTTQKIVNPYEHLEKREEELNAIRLGLLGSKDTKQKIIKVNKEEPVQNTKNNETLAKHFIENLFQ